MAKLAPVDAESKSNLVISAPASVKLPRRFADQLLEENEFNLYV